MRSTIRMLGNLLGDTIVEQGGQDLFDLEEQVRALSKSWRAGDQSAADKISQLAAQIADDLPKTHAVLKAFTTYFQLVNLAEEEQRVHVLRERARDAHASGVAMGETILHAVQRLKSEGLDAAAVRNILADLFIMPVFTAHPTETKRRTILLKLKLIAEALFQLDRQSLLPDEREHFTQELRENIVLLWQSDETRSRRPTVLDEVRNGLYFFEASLFDQLPKIYNELNNALAQVYPGEPFATPDFLRFGSWIGGDRDGNPFVTLTVTEETLRTQKRFHPAPLQYSNRRPLQSSQRFQPHRCFPGIAGQHRRRF
ncbi:MAG: phosphoenolpyruvate carboxylase [Caldilineaceae bacterium]|nr:phosphoenolpyruvate carboxylase [Caldilineaceae bacterium]